MNQQQLLALYLPLLSPIATLAIVMVGFLDNNGRLNDMRDLLRAEIKIGQTSVEADIKMLQATMEKNHSELLARFAGLESRVSRIEEKVR